MTNEELQGRVAAYMDECGGDVLRALINATSPAGACAGLRTLIEGIAGEDEQARMARATFSELLRRAETERVP